MRTASLKMRLDEDDDFFTPRVTCGKWVSRASAPTLTQADVTRRTGFIPIY